MMKITPLDIYNKRFRKKLTLWSYQVEEVDEFVDHLGSEFEKVCKETEQLRAENIKLNTLIQKYKEDEIVLRQSLLEAQEASMGKSVDLEREKEIIIEEAKLKAQNLLDEVKERIQEKYSQYNRLVELEELFKVRFKTLLESHLRYLEQMGEAAVAVVTDEYEDK